MFLYIKTCLKYCIQNKLNLTLTWFKDEHLIFVEHLKLFLIEKSLLRF